MCKETVMRILIVEDERTLCDTIARSLRNLAYSVDCCHDGQEALDLLNVEAFDLVVLDLNLPRIDGMTVLRAEENRLRDQGSDSVRAWRSIRQSRRTRCRRQRLPYQAVSSGRTCGKDPQPYPQALRTKRHSINLRKAQL